MTWRIGPNRLVHPYHTILHWSHPGTVSRTVWIPDMLSRTEPYTDTVIGWYRYEVWYRKW